MTLTAADLTGFMQEELGIDTAEVDSSSLLFTSGIVDSFSLVSLVTFIERQCGFTVQPDDVTLENLDSIQRIVDFAAARRQEI